MVTPTDQHQTGQAGDSLGGRPYVDDGVLSPPVGPRAVGEPAPDIDEGLAVDVNGDACANLFAGGDVVSQRGADPVEALVAISVNYVVHLVCSVRRARGNNAWAHVALSVI
jgi:hypothetical protein